MINSIRVLNADPYRDMKEAALKTMGLRMKKSDCLDVEWVRKSIVSRHSHIRCVTIRIEFDTIKSVRDQLLRSHHGNVEPYVCSQRPDRNNGVPRGASPNSTWYHDFNIEGLIKMAQDRLCGATEINTREEIELLKTLMMRHQDPIVRIVGDMLAPKCAWYADCNEFKPKNCFGLVGRGGIRRNIDLYNERRHVSGKGLQKE